MNDRRARGAAAAVLLAMAALTLAPIANAIPQDPSDFVGSWEVEMNMRGRGATTQVITFALDGDGNLTGTWGQGELTDVKFDAGKVTFKRAFGGRGGVDRGGRGGGAMENEVTIKDGKLAGKMTTPRGEMEYVGVRKAS